MDKEAFKHQLEKYDFNFKDFNNVVTIKLGYAQVVDVDFNLFEKILISDRLLKWNFLSGIIGMKLKHAVFSDFLALLILGVLFMYEGRHAYQYFLTIIFTLAVAWVLLWTIYYNMKAESFKSTLMIWLEDQ